MNAYLFKPRRRVGGKLRESKLWHVRYQLDGQDEYKARCLRVRDKQVAQQKLNEFVRELEREAAGVIVPKPLREGAGRSMAQHLADFVADLRARKRSRMYVHNVEKRATKLLTACGWTFPRDVNADGFTAWRTLQSMAPKTLNDYLDVAGGLLNWMQRRGRIIANPLACVGKVQTAGKQVRIRRAFTVAELQQLLNVAGERRPLYLTALLTGLRRNELRALRWSDVHLDAVKPFLSVRASTTKNGKAATIWLRDDLVTELRKMKPADAVPGDLLFPRLGRKLDEFKADLAAAKIPFKLEGRQADFHSLRHTLGTMCSRANVAPRVTMEMMRHSEIRLTMNAYTDASMLPTAEALDRLPRFDKNSSVALVATGTDGCGHDTQTDTQNLVQQGQKLSMAVTRGDERAAVKNAENAGECAIVSAVVQANHDAAGSWGTRIRT